MLDVFIKQKIFYIFAHKFFETKKSWLSKSYFYAQELLVAGSNPASPTTKYIRGVAQLVEQKYVFTFSLSKIFFILKTMFLATLLATSNWLLLVRVQQKPLTGFYFANVISRNVFKFYSYSFLYIKQWFRSSVGQSNALLRRRSKVRILSGSLKVMPI